jgi:hypothetical protein
MIYTLDPSIEWIIEEARRPNLQHTVNLHKSNSGVNGGTIHPMRAYNEKAVKVEGKGGAILQINPFLG